VPSPKTMRVAVANSKRMVLPALGSGKDGVVLRSLARLGHHGRNRIAPLRVVRGLLMRGRRFRRAVDLGEHEPCRIVLLLHHVKARDAGLLHARAGVLDGGLPELLYDSGLTCTCT
jgi:hypothetical protein